VVSRSETTSSTLSGVYSLSAILDERSCLDYPVIAVAGRVVASETGESPMTGVGGVVREVDVRGTVRLGLPPTP
jgi:hypothetical protein